MKKDLQHIKAIHKINLISQLIEALVEYNNIEGYTNQKKFTIGINYRKERNNPNYYYSVNISRGTNEPKNIFNMRFVYDESISTLIKPLIERFINNQYFSYTSFSINTNQEDYNSYNINLKNNVIVELAIKGKEDLELYKEIEKRFNKKEIILLPPEAGNKTKDELQQEKAVKIIDIFSKIFNIFENYNSIEDYSNKKEFKLVVSNKHNEKKDCFVYNFSIIRGSISPEPIFKLGISIRDKSIIYDKLYDFIIASKSKNGFITDMLVPNGAYGSYEINLKNNISMKFDIDNEEDKKFYTTLMRETETVSTDQHKELKKVL